MRRILKVEIYTFFKNWAALVMLFFFFLLGVLFTKELAPINDHDYFYHTSLEVLNRSYYVSFSTLEDFLAWYDSYAFSHEAWFNELVRESTMTIFFGLVFPAYVIGQSFAKRTVDIPLYTGLSRGKVFLVKLAYFYLCSTVYLFAVLIAEIFIFGKGWPTQLSAQFVCLRIFLRILLDMATLSVPLMLTFLFRDFLKSLCANVIYVAFLLCGERFVHNDAWHYLFSNLPSHATYLLL